MGMNMGDCMNSEVLNEEDLDFYGEQLEEAEEQIRLLVKTRRISVQEAAERYSTKLKRIYRRHPDDLGIAERAAQQVVLDLNEDARRRQIISFSTGTSTKNELKLSPWYNGVSEDDVFWPRLRERMLSHSGPEIMNSVDSSSDEVVAQMSNPAREKLKKKGLVLGFVQSGKTANYAAVVAKALDQGYRLIIVLSGIHNNLRLQTQVRLDSDLSLNEAVQNDAVYSLTSINSDFAKDTKGGAALVERDVPMIAVVKKNKKRLEYLNDWLSKVPVRLRSKLPILIIDDEADQATPNTATEMDKVSVINGLLRQLWKNVEQGTYIGYTATPFANVFMDPDDDDELFPSDFIIALSQPAEYYGAERVFGEMNPNSAEEPNDGLDMVRIVPDSEAESIRPPFNSEDRAEFDFYLPSTLETAVRWFIISTAIRRTRGHQSKHSSMLVHTTHYADSHFQIAKKITSLVKSFILEVQNQDDKKFVDVFHAEYDRVSSERVFDPPVWDVVSREIENVLNDCEIIVDNSSKEAGRINYAEVSDDGEIMAKTAIVVGGGTLSRGLTLEGLVVSYFIRTTSMYDTLLQMGRWFGYRNGYADLPRIWTQKQLILDFQFLAKVESEIRTEISTLAALKKTPFELGIRIREHPGRLQITSRNKLFHADRVRFSLSGRRIQTFILDEKGSSPRANMAATRAFLSGISNDKKATTSRSNVHSLFSGIDSKSVISYLNVYSMHEKQLGMKSTNITEWIRTRASEKLWNVVVFQGPKEDRIFAGAKRNLGSADLGLGPSTITINRAPLKDEEHCANIKALMSTADVLLDIEEPFERKPDTAKFGEYMSHRRLYSDNRGLLVIYPISKNSVPTRIGENADSRRSMDADEHLVGLGLVFPEVDGTDQSEEGNFYSVRADWAIESSAIADLSGEDDD